MPAIYCADVWCDSCAQKIRDEIQAKGLAPSDPDDETSYDSDECPKYMSDDEEFDCPQNCAAGGDCLEAWILPSGRKIGCQMGRLTSDGEMYVLEMAREELEQDGAIGEVVQWWGQFYELELPSLETAEELDE